MYSAGIIVWCENTHTTRHCTIITTILSNTGKPAHFSWNGGFQEGLLKSHACWVECRDDGFDVLNPRPKTSTIPRNKGSYFLNLKAPFPELDCSCSDASSKWFHHHLIDAEILHQRPGIVRPFVLWMRSFLGFAWHIWVLKPLRLLILPKEPSQQG